VLVRNSVIQSSESLVECTVVLSRWNWFRVAQPWPFESCGSCQKTNPRHPQRIQTVSKSRNIASPPPPPHYVPTGSSQQFGALPAQVLIMLISGFVALDYWLMVIVWENLGNYLVTILWECQAYGNPYVIRNVFTCCYLQYNAIITT
jgi:hypothetical protein